MKLIVDNIRELKLKQFFLWISTLGLIAVIIWIALGIQDASQKSTIDKEMTALIKPINTVIDHQVFNLLKDRFIPPEEFTVVIIENKDGVRLVTPLRSTAVTGPLSSVSASPASTTSYIISND